MRPLAFPRRDSSIFSGSLQLSHSASVTGLTRDGVWYVEDGEIKYPVRNFRFNQSIALMLAPGNVDLIGVPERVASSEGGTDPLLVPALRLNAFNFTSQSEAV